MAGEGYPTGYAITMSTGAGTAGSNTFGMSNLGNTSGTSGVLAGAPLQYLFAGGNNITLSQSVNGSSATLTISAFNESQSIGISNVGNTAGTSGPASGANVRYIFAGGNNVTLSQSVNGASGSLSIAAGGTLSMFYPNWGSWAPGQYGNGSIQVFPVFIPEYLSASQANFFVSASISTSSNSSHAGVFSIQFGIYSNNAGTLSSLSSGSSFYQWTNTSDNSTASLNVMRIASLPINISASPGHYWMALWSRTSTTNANWATISNYVFTNSNNFGGFFAAAAIGTQQWIPGMGFHSLSSASLPGTILFADLNGTGAQARLLPVFNLVNFTV